MGASYKLVVDGTEYTNASGVVARIESEERREKHSITTLTAELLDPEWHAAGSAFGKIKDPAFSNVPVKLYLAKAGEARANQVLVFDGKLTTIGVGYPERRSLTLVAHDESIDARRRKSMRVFKGKNAVQVAQAIAREYGFKVDTSQVDELIAGLVVREVDSGITPSLSDWDHLQRSLSADGFVAAVKGKTIHVTRAPSVAYATTFHRGRFPVISLNVSIQHVRGPGKQGDVRTSNVFFDGASTDKALRGTDAKRGDKEQAEARTGRRPVGGAAHSSDAKSHAEDMDGSNPKHTVEWLRKRKDSAQLTIYPAPDLSVLNNVRLADFGAKVDGTWFVESVKHTIAGGDANAVTAVGLVRGASPGALKGAQLT